MPKQHVMDRTGHTTHVFDRANVVSVEEAEKRFKKLTGLGFTAARKKDDGSHELVRSFSPEDEETLFFPNLQGG